MKKYVIQLSMSQKVMRLYLESIGTFFSYFRVAYLTQYKIIESAFGNPHESFENRRYSLAPPTVMLGLPGL